MAGARQRHGVRTRRCPGQQAAPRHGGCPPAVLGQAVHGRGDRTGAGGRLHFDGPDRVRCRLHGDPLRHPGQCEREFAARVGRHDERSPQGVRPGQSGLPDFAVHHRRRHGTSDPAGADRASPCRGHDRDCPHPAGAARFADDLRQLSDHHGSPLGCADVRDRRVVAGHLCHRPARPTARPALPLWRPLHGFEDRRCAGHAGIRRCDDAGTAGRGQLHPAGGRVAGGRSDARVREVRDGRRPLRHAAPAAGRPCHRRQ